MQSGVDKVRFELSEKIKFTKDEKINRSHFGCCNLLGRIRIDGCSNYNHNM